MLTLCIDTAYKHLTCALIQDETIIASYSEECFKRQSEQVFLVLEKLFNDANVERTSIDSICISEGPGSYTGVRIAMTIAKVIGETMSIDVYTISTLRLYAANNDNTLVMFDARANRAYVGIYNFSECLLEDCVMSLDDIDKEKYNIVGDANLIGLEDNYPNIAEAFLKTKNNWLKQININYLVPKYLKESESYLK